VASHRASTFEHPCRPVAILPLPISGGSPPLPHSWPAGDELGAARGDELWAAISRRHGTTNSERRGEGAGQRPCGTASAGWHGEGVGRRVREGARWRAWDRAVLPPWRWWPAVGVAGRWVEVRDDLFFFSFFHFLFFYWTDKWVPIHVSTYRTNLGLTSGSHLSDSVSIRVQLAISAN
jgi:hypothetical protein